ncbi:MAG: hypothetical protein FWC21_06635 [Treponema sp.]|nr:hypothetical protein [Treponema sp.]
MNDNEKPIEKTSEQKPKDGGLIPFIIKEKIPLVPWTVGKYDKILTKLITHGQMGDNIRV